MAPENIPFQTIRVVSADRTLRITLSEYAISLVIDGHVFFFLPRNERFVTATTTATFAPGHNGEADTPAECIKCVAFLARAAGQP
jgi:hypothetical protein